MKSLAGYLMRGPTQAILVTSSLALLSLLLPPLRYLSGAAVVLVTLRLGVPRGLWISGGAALGVALLSLVLIGDPTPGLLYFTAEWLPLLVLGASLRRTASLERTLILAAVFGSAMVVGFLAGVENPLVRVQSDFEQLLREGGHKPETAAAMQEAYALMTHTVAALATLGLLISLFIARWWQAQLYNQGGFQREFHALRFGRPLSGVTLFIAAFALFGGADIAGPAGDLLMVFGVLHLLQGLAVAHHLVKRAGAHPAWFAMLYGSLLTPAVVMVTAIGFVDSWFDFRTFFGPKSQEG